VGRKKDPSLTKKEKKKRESEGNCPKLVIYPSISAPVKMITELPLMSF